MIKRIVRHMHQHRDTGGMDADGITDVAQQAAEWLTLRGYTHPTDADIADALNAVCWW